MVAFDQVDGCDGAHWLDVMKKVGLVGSNSSTQPNPDCTCIRVNDCNGGCYANNQQRMH
jgi:hypothetical protein